MKTRSVPRTLSLAVRIMRLLLRLLGALAPSLAAAQLYRLWFLTPRYPEPKREQGWRGLAEVTYLKVNNENIAVCQWGPTGQPLVYLLHGWSGRAAQLGAFVQPLNQSGFTVISFDAPGHGASTGSSTTIFRITECLHQVTLQYGMPAHVIAHSFGCMVCALAIKKQYIQPRSLVTISSPTRAEYLVQLFMQTLQVSDRVRKRFDSRLKDDFGKNVYEDIAADSNLSGCEIPALVIHDKHDTDVQWKYSQRLVDAMPNATALYTEGLGHRRILRDTPVIETVTAFVLGIESGDRT